MSQSSNQNLRVTLRFYGDLNGFLYENHNGKSFERALPESTSVKDLIEGCGIPHTEVDLISADGDFVDFSFTIQGGERVSVYPFFNSLDIDPSTQRTQRCDRREFAVMLWLTSPKLIKISLHFCIRAA